MSNFNAAIVQYHNEYGSYPIGYQAEIIRCLLGDNSRKIQFLSLNANELNPDGDFVDPWQTPYQIKMLEGTNLVISSAGPNKEFGDKDDIIFNSVSNNFVKP